MLSARVVSWDDQIHENKAKGMWTICSRHRFTKNLVQCSKFVAFLLISNED